MTTEFNKRMSKAQKTAWANPKVHKARSKRMAIKVGKDVYPSMAQAVAALGIKLSAPGAYVPIRTRVAKEGKVKWMGYTFINAGLRSDYVWE